MCVQTFPNIAVNRQSELTQTHGVASEMDNIIFYVCFVWTLYQARHLGGLDHKAEILPRQHPPESTILLKSTAKINKNPDLCVASPNAKYQF